MGLGLAQIWLRAPALRNLSPPDTATLHKLPAQPAS